MPESTIARRGGARRVRTKKLPNGRYIHIFVVGTAGPRGGHTVAGEPKKKAKRRKNPTPDDSPHYRMKPDVPERRKKAKSGT